MFHHLFKNRFHESIACAALLAGALTLQVMWIVNLLVVRIPFIARLYTIIPSVGPISGMYLKAIGTFVFVFLIAGWYWRGKDCSHHRKSLLSFFLFSTLIFFVMTLPFVYSFSVRFE
ncbi:hypothetical protein A3C09_00815 [Candidatus Uhrbacteria bacterium RIFCSPHIGHO2_02_FULL_47_44]|uniref:Uncharacterized protein n=1 Tax=Candidatus Uhrbacteria bacterium RIFCSPLOWO2_02_FULL_48_18 TaxID=1802408 RepID=A0A1F7VD43_9BACT|nr:MAG: hypothetical protein A2839_05180 [Candidatus Uhrbacteria bacterium RIFCSPHIGHO2_01_FULL_47_10]OGL71496.1 MAG: hypothetical protein A3C09_00815 [Candidatus Uhrbacteria bacterium RIFCSPHIGHO2_02_FULL_47_44]OGL77675.1 MAG: hypothetical protein A3E97_04040 [Candidatus Uhrbacteria bacterium RIFCSPHIGHO2_12_FULL_47_12]OGL82392.1 MAG: hypothetical protein A3B20_01405 [Candidatus Uhrbacteria bacterium RIFCSPLOWO2_01_FULL_47_17]OGL88038.1 MAG: hypothetical protein A3I41_02935 [Candidatus Uhrbact